MSSLGRKTILIVRTNQKVRKEVFIDDRNTGRYYLDESGRNEVQRYGQDGCQFAKW